MPKGTGYGKKSGKSERHMRRDKIRGKVSKGNKKQATKK